MAYCRTITDTSASGEKLLNLFRPFTVAAIAITLSGCVVAINTSDHERTKDSDTTASSTAKSDAELLHALMLARAKLAADPNLPDASRQRILETLDEQISRLKTTKP